MGSRELAARFLAAVEAGERTRELRDALARAVLDRRDVQLAREVEAGGSHATRRAIELAELLASERDATGEQEMGS
ncbi:MAG: hypothetical protein ACOCUS_03535 [Polyangiales bacterium]